MRSKFFLILGIMGLLIVALVTRQSMLLADLQSDVRYQIDEIAGSYQEIAERYAIPLASYDEFTAEQSKSMVDVRRQYSALHQNKDILETAQDVIALQIALQSFLSATPSNSPVAQDGRFLALQSRMGKSGEVRALLKEYNNTAKRWNNYLGAPTAALSISFNRIDTRLLPYLHFMGQENYVPVISL